jgi:hypothetical protein
MASEKTFKGEVLALFLFFLGVGIYASYPLIGYLSKAIPYAFITEKGDELLPIVPGDHLQIYYWFWLFKDNLLGASPFFSNPYEFNIGPGYLQHGYAQFPLSVLYVILSVFGNIAAQNLLILLSFPFSGLAAYFFIRLWIPSRLAAVAGALIFALAPARQTQLFSGHINGYVSFLIPLFLYLFERGYRNNSLFYIVLSGLCFFSIGLIDPHLLYYLLLFFAFYFPFRVLGSTLIDSGNEVLEDRTGASLWPPFLVAELGGLTGYWMYQARFSLHQEPAFGLYGWASIILYPLFFLILWLFISQLFFYLTGGSLSSIRKKEALSYLPVLGLSLYPHEFLQQSIPGRRLFILGVILAILAGKVLLQAPLLGSIRRLTIKTLPWKKIFWVSAVLLVFIGFSVGYSVYSKKQLVHDSIVGQGRTWQELRLFSPKLEEIGKRENTRTEGFVYPGLFSILLLGALLAQMIRPGSRLKSPDLFWAVFFWAALLISYVLAFGPFLDPVFPVYKFLFTYLPYFNFPRSPGRILVLSFLCQGFLCALSLQSLKLSAEALGKAGRLGWVIVTVLLGCGVLWDFHPQGKIGLTLLDEKNPNYRFLAQFPKDKTLVLGLPLFPGDSHQSSLYEYYLTLSRIRMVNGYSPVVAKNYVDRVFWSLINLNVGEIGPKEYELLQKMGVTHIVHHQEIHSYKVSPFTGFLAYKNLRASPYLKCLRTDHNQSLFQVLPPDKISPGKPVFFKEPIGVVYELEEMPHSVGQVVTDPEASMGKAVMTRKERDKAGRLAGSTYRFFPTGKYQAVFRLKVENNTSPEPILTLDLISRNPKKVLASREVRGQDFSRPLAYQRLVLPFVLEEPTVVEFRVLSLGRETIWANKIVVSFADLPATPRTYVAEEGFRYLVQPVQDPSATNGWAVMNNPERDHPAYIIFGPYQTYPRGNYRALFRIKTAALRETQPLLRLDVSAERGTRVYSQKDLRGTDFSSPEVYQDFELPFRLSQEEELEFRVYTYNRQPFWVDRIQVIQDK